LTFEVLPTKEALMVIKGLELDKLYTEKLAAGFLGVHPQTLKEWRLSGKVVIAFKTPTGRIRYLGRDILTLLRR
jgi:hypothetical protein